MTEKRCTRCESTKPVSVFGKNKSTPDGFSYWCKDCVRAAYREKNGTPKAKTKSKVTPAKSQANKAAEPAAVAPDLTVRMLPGLGFEAELDADDNVLRVRQANSEGGADELVLSRTEAKVLFAQFHDWVHG